MFDPYLHWFGIPPGQRPPNWYQLLAVDQRESVPAVIEQRTKARLDTLSRYRQSDHAELCPRLETEIQSARAGLLDPARRMIYDLELGAQGRTDVFGPQTSPPARGCSRSHRPDGRSGKVGAGSGNVCHAARPSPGCFGPGVDFGRRQRCPVRAPSTGSWGDENSSNGPKKPPDLPPKKPPAFMVPELPPDLAKKIFAPAEAVARLDIPEKECAGLFFLAPEARRVGVLTSIKKDRQDLLMVDLDKNAVVARHGLPVTKVFPSMADLSPDGRYYALNMDGQNIAVWSLADKKFLDPGLPPVAQFGGLYFVAADRLVVIEAFGTVRLFEVPSLKQVGYVPPPKAPLANSLGENAGLALSGDRRWLAVATRHHVRIIDTSTSQIIIETTPLPAKIMQIRAMAFSPDHQSLAVIGEEDRAIRFYDSKTGAEQSVRPLPAEVAKTPLAALALGWVSPHHLGWPGPAALGWFVLPLAPGELGWETKKSFPRPLAKVRFWQGRLWSVAAAQGTTYLVSCPPNWWNNPSRPFRLTPWGLVEGDNQ